MTKRIVSGIFILTALGALGIILAGALTSGEQLIVRFLTAVVVAALGLYVISDLRLQADDDAVSAHNRRLSGRQPASIETAPNSTAAFMATVTTRKQDDAALVSAQAAPVEHRPTARPARPDRRSVLAVGDAPTTGHPASGDPIADPDPTRTRTMAAASALKTTVLDEGELRRAVADATNGTPANDTPRSNTATNGGAVPARPADPPLVVDPAGPTVNPIGTPATVGGAAVRAEAAAPAAIAGQPATPNGVGANGVGTNGVGTNGHGHHGSNGSGRNGVSLISGSRRLSTPLGGFDTPGNDRAASGPDSNATDGKTHEVRSEVPVGPIDEPFDAPLEAITTARIPNLEELAKLGPRPPAKPNGADGSTTVVIPMADLPTGADTGGGEPAGGPTDSDLSDSDLSDSDLTEDGPADAGYPSDGETEAATNPVAGPTVAGDDSVVAELADSAGGRSTGTDGLTDADGSKPSFDAMPAVDDREIASEPATPAPTAETTSEAKPVVAEHDWPMPGRAPAPETPEVIDVTTTDEEPVTRAPVALAPTSRPPARRLPTAPKTGADAADYADAPLAPIIDLREVHTLNAHGNIDNAIKAGELEVISTLIEQGMLSTDGPVTDRDVRTMVYVAFTSNELRKLLLAGGSPDRPNHGLDLGPVELFDERQHAPIPKTIYPGKPRVIESGQESARSQLG